MGRYKPNLIDGVAGLALGGEADGLPPPTRAAHKLTASELAGRSASDRPDRPPMISEPEPGSATLDDWISYRRQVGPLAGYDPAMRLALAVAETQIAKLRERMQNLNAKPTGLSASAGARIPPKHPPPTGGGYRLQLGLVGGQVFPGRRDHRQRPPLGGQAANLLTATVALPGVRTGTR